MTKTAELDNKLASNEPKEKIGFKQKCKNLWNYFSTYEKIWFFSILILTIVFAFVFPEDSEELAINPTLVMMLYIIDIISNVACELLIAKQSKWNFLVSLIVEFAEISLCIVCAYRWATCAVTIFFWIPIDIISFFYWRKHADKEDDNLTEVRKLTWWQDIILVVGIAIWTFAIGCDGCIGGGCCLRRNFDSLYSSRFFSELKIRQYEIRA